MFQTMVCVRVNCFENGIEFAVQNDVRFQKASNQNLILGKSKTNRKKHTIN